MIRPQKRKLLQKITRYLLGDTTVDDLDDISRSQDCAHQISCKWCVAQWKLLQTKTTNKKSHTQLSIGVTFDDLEGYLKAQSKS